MIHNGGRGEGWNMTGSLGVWKKFGMAKQKKGVAPSYARKAA